MINNNKNRVKEQKEGRDDSFEVGDSLISYPLKQDSLFSHSETDSMGNDQTTIRTSSIKWKEELTNQTGDNKANANNKARQGSVHTQNAKDAIRSTCIRNEKRTASVSTQFSNKLKSDHPTKYSVDQQTKYDGKHDAKYESSKYDDRKFDDNFGSNTSKLTATTTTASNLAPSRTSTKSKINQAKYSDQLNVIDRFYKSPSSNLSSDFYSDKNCLLRVHSNTHIDQPQLHYGSDNYGCSNEKVQHINLHSNISISLEDVALPNDSGLGVGLIKREDSSLVNKKLLKKTLSFDDLKTLKNQLTYCLNATTDTANNSQYNSNCNLMIIEDSSVRNSLRSLIINSVSPLRHYNYNKFETVRNSNLSKEEVIVLWRNSERELLNTLNDILVQKKQIEEKCIILQRMLTNLK